MSKDTEKIDEIIYKIQHLRGKLKTQMVGPLRDQLLLKVNSRIDKVGERMNKIQVPKRVNNSDNKMTLLDELNNLNSNDLEKLGLQKLEKDDRSGYRKFEER